MNTSKFVTATAISFLISYSHLQAAHVEYVTGYSRSLEDTIYYAEEAAENRHTTTQPPSAQRFQEHSPIVTLPSGNLEYLSEREIDELRLWRNNNFKMLKVIAAHDFSVSYNNGTYTKQCPPCKRYCGNIIVPVDESGSLKTIHAAVLKEDKNRLQEFLKDSKTDVNAKDEYGNTAAHYAVSIDHMVILSLLLQRGADITITCPHDGASAMNLLYHWQKSRVSEDRFKGAETKNKRFKFDFESSLSIR